MKLNKKRLFSLLAAASLSLSLPFQSLAYGPGGDEEGLSGDYDQETLEKLQDNIVEYEELGDLIYEYNTTIKNALSSLKQSEADYKEIRTGLAVEKQDSKAKKEDAEDDGDMENYQYYTSQEAIYKSSIKMYNQMIQKLSRPSSQKQINRAKRQLTVAAQSLMISWQSVKSQTETLEKMKELYQSQYELTVTKQAAGLATETDVLTAKNLVLSADTSLSSMAASQEEIYSSLCAIIGRQAENLEIQSIPSADLSRIADMNLEADTLKAIDNNFSLIDLRSSGSKADSAVASRTRTREETEENIKIEMEQLYQAVIQAKTAYEAADAGYQSAVIAKNNADSKYQIGMLSRAEYLAEELTFQQKKAAMEAADLTLFQAMETYSWAVNGILDV